MFLLLPARPNLVKKQKETRQFNFKLLKVVKIKYEILPKILTLLRPKDT